MNFKEFDNPREKPQVRPVTNMDPKELDDRIEKAKAKLHKRPEQPNLSQLWTKEKLATEDAGDLKTAYTQIAQLANDVKQEPENAEDQWDVADEVQDQ